ncbi:MAG: phage portal protein [Bacteriovoracaceae bacterium]|nr:phage portal protein [Bacteriovoracaceae bacterium]
MGRIGSFIAKLTGTTGHPDAAAIPFRMSAGTIISPDTCMEVSAFHRGLIYLSSQIAKLPFNLKDINNGMVDDDLLTLLQFAPNPEMSAFSFRLLSIQSAIIYGNHYAEIERDYRGKPTGIYPIDQGSCEPVRDTSGKLWYRISANASASGQEIILPPSKILHTRNFHTKDGIISQGVVAYAAETLGTSRGADKFANSLFTNGGLPSGVVTVPGALSDEAFTRLKESWDKNHSGRKTGGTAILEEGAEFKPVSISPDVLQFLESRKFSVLEIARFLGIPPQKLFDGESATYNNIEHANLEVTTDTLDAWACNLESEVNMKMVRNNPHTKAFKSELDLRAVYRGDMETKAKYYTSRMQNASITPNQIRQMEGDAPYEGGDEYYIAANNFSPVSRLDEIIDSQIAGKKPEGPNTSKSDEDLTEAVTSYLKKKKN